MKRISTVAGRSALVTAALAVALSGCSVLSPAITAEPYAASDGANIDMPDSAVVLRNFIVIGAEKGAPAVVVGAVINSGPSEVQVSIQTDFSQQALLTQTMVRVGAKSIVQIGPDQEFEMAIPELPIEPGSTVAFSAATAAGGKADLIVPILRPEDEYSSLTPAPTTPAPLPTTAAPTKKKSKAEPSATDEAQTEPTESPSAN